MPEGAIRLLPGLSSARRQPPEAEPAPNYYIPGPDEIKLYGGGEGKGAAAGVASVRKFSKSSPAASTAVKGGNPEEGEDPSFLEVGRWVGWLVDSSVS